MSIQVTCQCGAKFSARPEWAGKRAKCPKCGQPLVVPQPTNAEHQVACECGRKYNVTAALAGKAVRCNNCGRQFRLPPLTSSPRPLALSAEENDPLASVADLGQSTDPLWDVLPNHSSSIPVIPQVAMSTPVTSSPSPPPAQPPKMSSKTAVIAIAAGVGGILLIAILAMVAVAVTRFAGRGTAIRHDSPEAVYETYKQASINNDMHAMFDIMSPESQEMTIGFALIATAGATSLDPQASALLKKHGVDAKTIFTPEMAAASSGQDPKAYMKIAGEATKKLKNPRAFYFDALKYYEKFDDEEDAPLFSLSAAIEKAQISNSTQLKNLVIDGDKAKGVETTTISGRTYEIPIEFRRIQDKWYVHFSFFGAGA